MSSRPVCDTYRDPVSKLKTETKRKILERIKYTTKGIAIHIQEAETVNSKV
jgi:hypothetical protein